MSEAQTWWATELYPTKDDENFGIVGDYEVMRVEDVKALCDERDRLLHDYHELIMAVETKYPGETRHQTALKYIRRAEESCNIPAQAALTPAGGGQDEHK